MVDDDTFGYFLVRELKRHGVDTSGVVFTQQARTALAFVSRDEVGDVTLAMTTMAKRAGCLVSVDANLRNNLWLGGEADISLVTQLLDGAYTALPTRENVAIR